MHTYWIGSATVAAALLMTACSKAPPPAQPVRAVKTMVVGQAGEATAREYAAQVQARTESLLGFQVGGRLIARPAQLGDVVKGGQALAQLDPRDLELGHSAAQAALGSAQTQLEQGQADYRRYAELQTKGFISAAELERRSAALKAAEAQRDQASAQASVQGRQASYATLAANGPGIVTAVLAEPGQVLSAGTPVLRVALDGPRDAVFSVAEQDAAAVRALRGKAGGVQVRLWGETATHPATVREVAGAADALTRTFLVKADLSPLLVRPGQTATVLLPMAAAGGLRVPLSAVARAGDATVVWVLDTKAMTVRPRPIQLAGGEGTDALVASGLGAGDEVVTAGVHVLTAGETVRRYAGAP